MCTIHEWKKKKKGITYNRLYISQRVALYSFVHLVYFPCTVSVIQLYNGAINE